MAGDRGKASDSRSDGAKSVFVISPIGETGTDDYERHRKTLKYIIQKALAEPEWHVVRADLEDASDSIGARVIQRIYESDLIVAILTDLNPNVFYELAVAHGYKKRVIHLMQVGQRIPFDVSDQRAIFYDLTDPESVDEAVKRLHKAATYAKDTEEESVNPLTQFDAFRTIREGSTTEDAGDLVAETLVRVNASLRSLNRRIDHIEEYVRGGTPADRHARIRKTFADGSTISDIEAISGRDIRLDGIVDNGVVYRQSSNGDRRIGAASRRGREGADRPDRSS